MGQRRKGADRDGADVSDAIDLSLYKEALLFLVTAGVVAPLIFPSQGEPRVALPAGERRARAR
jgi:hypothetical protein